MKKSKNIVLLVGILCMAVVFLWSIIRFLGNLSGAPDSNGVTFLLFNDLYPALCLLLLMVLPILLLVRNLKDKGGKVLPILSIAVNSLLLVFGLFSLVTPAIPQYIVFSKLGLVDTYFTIVFPDLAGGGPLLVGYLLTIVGSVLSLPKKEKQRA